MNSGVIADLALLKTLLAICQKSWELRSREVIDFLCFSSICKLVSFKNPSATITCMSELYKWKKLFCELLQQHKLLKTMEWGLTWYLWWAIYTSIPTWTDSQNSLAAAEAPSLKISPPWNISQMITKTIPISTRIVISYAMKWGILLWISWKVNGNWDNNMIRISQWRESHCKTNTSIRRKKEIQKSRTVRIKVRDLSRKVNHLSMVIWNRKIMTELTRSISPTRIVKPVLMLFSRDKNISRWVDRENLIYVR